MTDPAQEEERRELERRAFGRDGSGLSRDEAARLTALRRAARPLPTGSLQRQAAVSLPTGSLSEDGEAERDETQRNEGPPTHAPALPLVSRSSDGSGDVVGETGQRRLFGTGRARIRAWLATGRWKRPRYLVGGLAGLLLVGVLIGWTIPRPPDVGLVLRAGEAERRDVVLKDSDHDPGSAVLLARRDDALLWTWTKMNGALRCAALDVPKATSERQCQLPGEMAKTAYSLQLSAMLPPAVDRLDTQVGYGATLFLAGQGFPGGSIQRWESDSRMRNQGMSAAEIEAAARLSTDQNLEGLSIVGRWRGLPVWRGFADDGSSQCLIVETPDPQRGCGSDGRTYHSTGGGGVTILGSGNADEESSIVLEVPATEERPSAIIDMRTGMYIGSYLMITENAAVGDGGLFSRK